MKQTNLVYTVKKRPSENKAGDLTVAIIKLLISWAGEFASQVRQDRVTVYGAQAAFFVMISAIPFVMLSVALLQFIMPVTQSQLSRLALDVVPLSLRSYVVRIIDELYNQTSVPLISVTAVSALWAASRSLYALAGGLKEIYNTMETRSYVKLRVLALLHTLLLLILLLFSLAILVFGNTLQLLLEQSLPILAQVSAYIISARTLLALSLLSLVFALMYKILPNTKSGFRQQLPGAVFSSLGWMIYSLAYSLYIEHYSSISYLYGSLTAIVLWMLWLYFCMNIFLLGAEINVWLLSTPESRP